MSTMSAPDAGDYRSRPRRGASGHGEEQDVAEPSNSASSPGASIPALRAQGIAGVCRRGSIRGADDPRVRDSSSPTGAGNRWQRRQLRSQRCRHGRGVAWVGGHRPRQGGFLPQSYQCDEFPLRTVLATNRTAGYAGAGHVVAVDSGAKHDIACAPWHRARCGVTMVTATATADNDILRRKPRWRVPVQQDGGATTTADARCRRYRGVLDAGVSLFGICLRPSVPGAGARAQNGQDGARSWRGRSAR